MEADSHEITSNEITNQNISSEGESKADNTGPLEGNGNGFATSISPEQQGKSAAHNDDKFVNFTIKGNEVPVPREYVDRLAQKYLEEYEDAQQTRERLEALESLYTAIQSDPFSALKQLGKDPLELSQKYLEERQSYEQLSPEQRRIYELEQQLTTFERFLTEQEETKKSAEAAEAQRLLELERDRQTEMVTNAIADALENSDLPQTEESTRRMAHLMYLALEQGVTLSPSDLVPLVKESYMHEIKSLVSALSGEQLYQYLGDDIAKKIREYDLSRIKPSSYNSSAWQQEELKNVPSPKGWLSTEELEQRAKQRI